MAISIASDTVSGQLLNAAPGAFFAVGGLVALIFSIVKGVNVNFKSESPEVKEGTTLFERHSDAAHDIIQGSGEGGEG